MMICYEVLIIAQCSWKGRERAMKAAESPQNLMKISKLAEITGVARDSSHYYIREGLLPEPVRTKKNMAYYDESYVERIKLIKELQNKRFLPLHVIKQILSEAEDNIGMDEIQTILELDGKLFKNMESAPDFKPMTIAELSERTGLLTEEIEKLKALGVLFPEEDSDEGVFGEDAIRIVEVWAKLRQSGFTEERGFSVEIIEMYREIIDVLAKREIRIFANKVTGKVSEDEAATMAEVAIPLLNSLIGLLRKQSIVRAVREYGPGEE